MVRGPRSPVSRNTGRGTIPDLERGRGRVRHLVVSPRIFAGIPDQIPIIWDEEDAFGFIYIGSIVWPSNSIVRRGWALVFGDLLSQSLSEKECLLTH